jgi:hypothetical protein
MSSKVKDASGCCDETKNMDDSACCGQLVIGYCQLKSNWADFLPRASNLNAEQSMSDKFVYGLSFGQIH